MRVQTDDRYLTSLKTIKRLTLSLDKLKVRIEALQRANALLLTSAAASAGSEAAAQVLAPPPASAKKRSLPKEFVLPDPGPLAVVGGPGMQTQLRTTAALATVERDEEQHQQRAVPALPDREVPLKGLSSSTESIAAPNSNASSKSGKEPTKLAGTGIGTGTGAAPQAPTTPSTALASSRPRRPLAVVQPQASAPQSFGRIAAAAAPKAVDDPKAVAVNAAAKPVVHKLGSLPSSRPAFKPSTHQHQQPSAGAEGAATKRIQGGLRGGQGAAPGGQTDTKSLLAALQALKRPA